MKLNLQYLLLQSFLCCAHGNYFGFLVVFLRENHYDPLTIGMIMTTLAVAGMLITPMWGYLSDVVFPVKRIVNVCVLAAIPAAFLLKLLVGVVPLALASILCMSLLERHMMVVVDSWGMKVMAIKPELNYGIARGTASLLYAISGLTLGRLFAVVGIDKLFYTHAILAGGCFIVSLFFDYVPVALKTRKKQSFGTASRILLKNKKFRLLLCCLMLAGVGAVSSGTFYPLRLGELGGTTAAMGASMFVMAASEMPVMFAVKHLFNRFEPATLLKAALFGIVLRMLANALAPNLTVLILCQALQALSYGLFLPVLLQYIREITDPSLTATAITMGIACFEGVFGILGNLVGGMVAQQFGVQTVLFCFAGFALLSFLLFTIGSWKQNALEHSS